MKTTIYELLGLIKDGKQPKMIKFCGNIYKWEDDWYLTKEKNYRVCLGGKEDCNILINAFNENVEIIEENKEIEELNLKDGKVIGTWENGSEYCYTLSSPQVVIIKKINELVKAVNSLKENK